MCVQCKIYLCQYLVYPYGLCLFRLKDPKVHFSINSCSFTRAFRCHNNLVLPLTQSSKSMRACAYYININYIMQSVLQYLQSTLGFLSSLQVKVESSCAVNVRVAESLVVSRSVAMFCTSLQPSKGDNHDEM